MAIPERSQANARIIKAPHGTKLAAQSWLTEAPMRILMNNLDPDVAENPDELIVYGGPCQAARHWESFRRILENLQNLRENETLLLHPGHAGRISKAGETRVLISDERDKIWKAPFIFTGRRTREEASRNGLAERFCLVKKIINLPAVAAVRDSFPPV